MRMLSVAKYTIMVYFRRKGINLPLYSTKVQGNHRVECGANDFCRFTRKFLQGVPRQTVTTQ
jgi:hypothetical protein